MQKYLLVFMLMVILGCTTACWETKEYQETSVSITPNDMSLENVVVLEDLLDKVPVVIYFSNDQDYLVAQKREILKAEGVARVVMQELVKGPDINSGLLPTLPTGTQLRDINIRNGLCTVDFSAELKTNHPGGSSWELMTVYSIVNTLTRFSAVEEVQILVEGQIVETLAGHVDLSKPLVRDEHIISK
ncbi:MAG: GerMN domain-containing protein [Desulfotomaculum sp.]|nr:GerMN domain-containing protein [Desulfotomaculum sp.]